MASKFKRKLKEFAEDKKIKKGEARKLGKISAGDIKTQKIEKKINKFGLKINKKKRALIDRGNVKPGTLDMLPRFNPKFPKGNKGNQDPVPGISSTNVLDGLDPNYNNYRGDDPEPLPVPKDRFAGLTTRMDEFTAGIQTKLDGMFAGQAERDAELERQEAERLRKFELNQRTLLGNEARAGQQANYRLGSAAGRMKGGTSGFKRRNLKKSGRIMSGISAGTSGTLNV
jgi:hypothetical protein